MPHVTTELIKQFLEMQQWVIGAEIDQTWGLQIAEQVVNAFMYDDSDQVHMVLQLLNIYRSANEQPETREATRAYLLYDLLTNGRYGLGISSTVADAHDDAFPMVDGGCAMTGDVLDAYIEVATFMAAETGLSTDPPFVDDLTAYIIEDFPCDVDSEAAIYALVLRAAMVEPWQSFPEKDRQEHRSAWTRRLAEIQHPADKGPHPHGRTRSPQEKVRENCVESMLQAIVAGPITRQQEREPAGNESTKVQAAFDCAPKGNVETCEIVFSSTTVPIPGPYMTFYANWVSFQAETSGERPTRVIVAAGESDEWAQKEFHAHRIDETPKRKKMVAEVIRKLEAQGWQACGTGEMWFSHRFSRSR